MVPSNDVGRALAYLGFSNTMKLSLLVVSVLGMWCAGTALAQHIPKAISRSAMEGTRACLAPLLITALLSALLSIAFRVPRSAIEVVAIPLMINIIGIGWLTLGISLSSPRIEGGDPEMIDVYRPIIAFAILLLIFQVVLRPGIRL
ncbi:hypothetical protein GCM10009087_23490 [Sphingomonas oligophenolica]